MIYDRIVRKIPINKGWSSDGKFHIYLEDGSEYLLRESAPDTFERKKTEFEHMTNAFEIGIPMCRPVEFGCSDSKVYAAYSWINGRDLREILDNFDQKQQYRYGIEAGKALRLIHSIPAPADLKPWEDRFNAKISRKIQMYLDCPLKYPDNGCILNYVISHKHLLNGRPQSYQHGDFHDGNMMIDENGSLLIIDFDREDYGDPWEEFNRIVWSAQISPRFASGMIDGYFDHNVPQEFWKLLCLYICTNALGSLPWAIAYGDREVAVMQAQTAEILEWYDHMRREIPSWYCIDIV